MEKNTGRYLRQMILKEVGMKGQEKISKAKILIVGMGGLGCPAAIYLAAAGVGTIAIIDDDVVDETNLQRQPLYHSSDIGKPKVSIAKKKLEALNPDISITTYHSKLTSSNALAIMRKYDLIIDGTDNLPSKYLINDACVLEKKPFIYGSVFQFQGQLSVFNYNNGPCYRCAFPNPPQAGTIPNCAEAGVLGVLPGIIGTLQATEALKLILGVGSILSGKLMIFNSLSTKFEELMVTKNQKCHSCGANPRITKLLDYEALCEDSQATDITANELNYLISNKSKIMLFDIREHHEQDLGILKGATCLSYTQLANGNLSFLDKIPKHDHIILYCRSGNRSGYIANILRKKGFTSVKNLAGGLLAWKKDIDKSFMVF